MKTKRTFLAISIPCSTEFPAMVERLKKNLQHEHYINYDACTPLESIGSFDYINYRTGNHKPTGLCNYETYEEISPDDF